MTDNLVERLTQQRDRARNLAMLLENELAQAEELIEKLNRQLAVAQGKELE